MKRELQVTAHDYIQQKILLAAKYLLDTTTMSINEIAEELGFSYANHFTRMFRSMEGVTPLKYRKGKKE